MEDISYDANGNIETYFRNGNSTQLPMDDLTYNYYSGTNRLREVDDLPANSGNYLEDIDDQGTNNYLYDNIGNLVKDVDEDIQKIEWTVYGKIKKIQIYREDGFAKTIDYEYDAMGNRIYKRIFVNQQYSHTFYVRDAQGNTLAVYTKVHFDPTKWAEQHLYGSSRVGMVNLNMNVPANVSWPTPGNTMQDGFDYGKTVYELSNHLGNVLATITDQKDAVQNGTTGVVGYYKAVSMTQTDYYPFGMQMVGRTYRLLGGYRYGFNGKENDNEVKGVEGSQQDYGMRIYDPRIGKFLSVDPMADVEPGWTPYRAFYNNPIKYIDPDGQLEYESAEAFAKANKGKTWDKDRGKGDWLKSDRENNTSVWQGANAHNLQQKDGYNQYTSIEQRAGFYGWYAVQEDLRGGETKWAGAAYIIAKQMTLMDVFYKSGDLPLMVGAKNAKDLNDFANAGNKAIFDDVFGRLRDNMNSSPLKGDAAKKWDEATLHREQFDIVQPIYERYVSYNPKLNNILQDFASGKGFARFMQMPPQLKFEGNIMNAQDRYNHGMFKVVPFYDMLRKAQRPRR